MARPSSPVDELLRSAAVDEIKRLRGEGYSVREIARRTGLSKTFVHDVSRGKRGISATRGHRAVVKSAEARGGLTIVAGIGPERVSPLTRTDASKIGRYDNALREAKKTEDFSSMKRFSGKAGTIRTKNGAVHLETDPSDLENFDDAGLLNFDEVFIGAS